MASNTPDQRSDEKVADFPRPENENDHVMGTQQQRDLAKFGQSGRNSQVFGKNFTYLVKC